MERFLQRGKRRTSLTPSTASTDKETCECSSTDSEDLATEKPAPKRNSKISRVWKYFKSSEDKKFAKCISCGKEYKTSGNTSNLRDHLKRFHPTLDTHAPGKSTADTDADKDHIPSTSSSSRSSMQSVASYFKRAILYDANSKRKNDIDRALTEMIAKDVQPYNIVENEGFVMYTQVLDPRYKLPSKTHLRDVLMMNMYKETSGKLAMILEGISNVAITCDLWTSCANSSFLTVTVHFVHNYALKTASLATKKLLDATNHSARSDSIVMKRQYMERALVNQEMDPLLWIKMNQNDFPTLKTLFFKYLCIPATSVESERVFSKAGQIVSNRRTRLKDENVNVLLFLNQNYWLK